MAQHLQRPGPGLAWESPRWRRSTSSIWKPTESTGFRLVIGSWKTMPMRSPGWRASSRVKAEQILAFEHDAPGKDPGRRARQQAHDRHGGYALAAAGFPDQPHGAAGVQREARLLDDPSGVERPIEADGEVLDGEQAHSKTMRGR